MAQPIPEGYSGPMAYLSVPDAAAAIDFYSRAFGARERYRMPAPGGKIGHAELELGGGVIMLSDPFPQASTKPPTEVGGTTASIMFYVEDVDAAMQKAADAGAEIVMPADDQFWGDRFGSLRDPFGHSWALATHVEDVPPEEMAARAEQAMAAMAG
jgi:PhnB protein